MVWTYRELCFDLGQQPNPQRGEMWRRIIAQLNWPSGTTTFWPMSEPDVDTPGGVRPRPDMFQRGADLIRPQYVVVFGLDAWEALCPGADADYGQCTLMDRPGLLFPSPEELLAADKDTKWSVITTLQQLLQR
jgi:hypothetical protein